jgi:hypothetical protein
VLVRCDACGRNIKKRSWDTHPCNQGGRVTCDVIVEVEGGAMVEKEAGATVGEDGRVRDMAGVVREDWKVCGREAANKSSLAAHKSAYHTCPFTPVTCSRCNTRFTSKSGWKEHKHNPSRTG